MKKFSIIVFFLAAVLTTACSIEETSFDNNIETKRLTIQAAGEDYGIIDSPETRTMRNEKTKATLWTKGDAISLFYGSGTKGGSKFTSTQEEDTVHVANFTGQISVITGGGESVTEQDTYFWGLYPYDSSASCDGTSITTTLPSNQVATPGTFANNLFPSLGHSQGLIMGFYNICGGLRFSVTKEGVKRVTLKGNNGEKIAGKYKVSLESGLPVSTADETSGKTEIVLEPPVGEFFKPGKNYYFVMIPTVFSQGFTLTFETLNETGIYERSVSTSIKRSMFSGLSNVDQNVSYSTPEGDNLLEQYMDDLYQSLYKGFTKNYTGQEKVNFSPNEFFLNQSGGGEEKRIMDACFFIVDKDGIAKRYHIECESNLDTTILLRIFEYDTQISLHDAKTDGNIIIVPFPHTALLALRKKKTTQDAFAVQVVTPGGNVGYSVPVLKMQDYGLEEIFSRNLLFFLPFFIFYHEKSFSECENDEAKLRKLVDEYHHIATKLDALQESGELSAFTKKSICSMILHVLALIAKEYPKIRKEVGGTC